MKSLVLITTLILPSYAIVFDAQGTVQDSTRLLGISLNMEPISNQRLRLPNHAMLMIMDILALVTRR